VQDDPEACDQPDLQAIVASGDHTEYSGSRTALHQSHTAEWHFPRGNATFNRPQKGTEILEPL